MFQNRKLQIILPVFLGVFLSFLILPFNSANAEKQECSCRCVGLNPTTDACREWRGALFITEEIGKMEKTAQCCNDAKPAGCVLSEYFDENCAELCSKRHPGSSCVDTTVRSGGATGCETGLCAGAANIKCCPSAAAVTPPAAATEDTSGAIKLINPLGGTEANPKGVTSIPAIIGRVIKTVLGIVGSIALLMFIYGGFMWMTAAGEAKKVEKGKQTLIWATIGLAVIFFSYAATSFVINAITGGGGS